MKQVYEKPDGELAIIAIRKDDKVHCDKLVRLLRLLGVHQPIDRDRLLNTWKSLEYNKVRTFLNRK